VTETTATRSRLAAWAAGVRQPWTLAFLVVLALGFALRVVFLFSSGHHMDSDHAVVYLMARHVAEGEFPAFFWGQSYGGSLLQWTAGVVMLFTGPSIEVLGVVSSLFWAAAAVFLRQIVLIAVGPVAGTLAATLFWFPGAVILATSVSDPGFYGPSLAIGLAAIWVSVRTPGERSIPSWALLGALGGLALWTSPMSVAFAAPGIILALMQDRRWRRWLIAAGFGALAAVAWIYETVVSRLSSVKPLGGASFHPESLASIFTAMFPAAFPGGLTELGAFAISLATVAATIGILVVGIRERNRAIFALGFATVFVIGVLVAGSGTRLAADSVRYSAFLLPGVALAIALLVARVRWRQAGRWVAVGVGAAALVVTTALVLERTQLRFDTTSRFDPSFTAVGELLEDEGIAAGYGSYWLAYSVSAVTEERVTLAAFVPARYPGYEVAAEGDEPMAVVVFAGASNDQYFRDAVGLPDFTRTEVDGVAVYLFDEWFDPMGLPLTVF
jgi:hypothetical protein